jgi:hypothetical protein
LWSSGGVAALVVVIILLGGYLNPGWGWTGFTEPKVRRLWDWLDLLIVPVVLAIGGYFFNSSQSRATEAAAYRRAQDEALQAYLEQLGQLLLDEDKPLRRSRRSAEERSVARARTLTVLGRLEGGRKGSVVQFLYEAGLITSDRAVIDLSRADISGAALNGVSLRYANLSHADLSHADLNGAFLNNANLSHTDLSGTNLSGANLFGANLSLAKLNEADLSHASLIDVSLKGADLSGAKLSITNDKLDDQAASLKGTTMPNGQKYEGWLKDREGRKEGEGNE